MNKKVLVSLAASLTLFASPFANKTEAAAPVSQPTVKVQCKTGTIVLSKEMSYQLMQGNVDWQTFLKNYGWTVQQPAKPGTQPAPTTKPAPAPTTKPAPETTKPAPAPSTKPTAGLKAFEQQVVDLTNQERQKAGLSALKIDSQLSSVARKKSEDMLAKNYFSHTSPTYGSPFDMMKQFGVTYRTAGENIAKGQRTPAEVVKAWMESPGHRANILNKDYTHIGVGYVENGNIWTQMFIGK
ncbi:CAP domain-containing protein [Bacillus sp. B190/17]|uniref:CAP domain-containing protein n=1 Tax=Bacillus lumedeiriae TaxID=3058829 RepID=A0ABW8I3T2_9BACI